MLTEEEEAVRIDGLVNALKIKVSELKKLVAAKDPGFTPQELNEAEASLRIYRGIQRDPTSHSALD